MFIVLILLGAYLLSIHSKQFAVAAFLFAFAAVFCPNRRPCPLHPPQSTRTNGSYAANRKPLGKTMFEKSSLPVATQANSKEFSRLFADLNIEVLPQYNSIRPNARAVPYLR